MKETIWRTYGIGGRVGTAGKVFLAALVDEVLEGRNSDDVDWAVISFFN